MERLDLRVCMKVCMAYELRLWKDPRIGGDVSRVKIETKLVKEYFILSRKSVRMTAVSYSQQEKQGNKR